MAKEKSVMPAAAPADDKKRAIDSAMSQIEKMYGKGSIMRFGDKAELTNLVIDKDVNVSRGSKIQGTVNYPMYIAKRSIV